MGEVFLQQLLKLKLLLAHGLSLAKIEVNRTAENWQTSNCVLVDNREQKLDGCTQSHSVTLNIFIIYCHGRFTRRLIVTEEAGQGSKTDMISA